jgi:hypothetical protein
MAFSRSSLCCVALCYFIALQPTVSAVSFNAVDMKNDRDSSYLKAYVYKPKSNKPLNKEFRIQYLVITGRANEHRAGNIWSTWGPTIGKTSNDSLLFISDSNHSAHHNIPILKVLDVLDHWELSQRYRQSQLKWLRAVMLTPSLPSFDWLVIIDDDTFVIHPAMREMLQRHDSKSSLMLGKKNGNSELGRASVCGGAGIIMSKTMVQRITSPKYQSLFIAVFESAVNDMDKNEFYSDVIVSKFVKDYDIGQIINVRELKNEPSGVIMGWYEKHPKVHKSSVITYHHVTNRSEYTALYNHYYLATQVASSF